MEPSILLRFQQGFSSCYGNLITRWYFFGIRRPQKSSSDLQRENEWRREPQPRKSGSHSIIPSSKKQPTSPSVSLFTSQYAVSLQPACIHSLLWVRNWLLGLGLYLQLQSSTPHAPAERKQLLSGILLYSFFSKDQELWGKHSTFSQRWNAFDNYPFEFYSFRNIYFYQPASHLDLTVFNNYHNFIKQVMR